MTYKRVLPHSFFYFQKDNLDHNLHYCFTSHIISYSFIGISLMKFMYLINTVKLARMKTIIKDERQIKLQQAALNVIPDKTHLRLINAHYSCGECYAAWFGPPVCISCGKKNVCYCLKLIFRTRHFRRFF